MSAAPIPLSALMAEITEPWQPRDVVTANDTILRIARLDGEFPWHAHAEDELFLCQRGAFRIELDGAAPIAMSVGDVFVVPRGTRHRPVADTGPAYTLLIERPETKQYGDQG